MGKTAIVGKEDIETDFSSEIIEIELPGGTRGLQGEQGIQGETGKTPQLHIGEIKDADTPEATITGTTDDPVLNMTLPRGKSGVWVGENEPDNEQYNVWVDPLSSPTNVPTKVSQLENDTGYITEDDVPTKTSDLTNDSGYITTNDIPKDIYSYQETLTNKVYVDSNNVEHPVYRKMFDITYDDLEYPIAMRNEDYSETYNMYGFVHNISNFSKLITHNFSILDKVVHRDTTPYTYPQGDFYEIFVDDEYVLFSNVPYGLPDFNSVVIVTLEYTKEED